MAQSHKARSREGHPSDRGREFETRLPSKGFFFLIFVSICMVMFIPVVVFSFFLRIDGFFSSVFFYAVFKLID